MKINLSTIDEEICELEKRIANDRSSLVGAMNDVGHSVRETASSPKTLLAVAGLGFIAGKLLFRSGRDARPAASYYAPPRQPSKLGGLLGVLAAGMSLMQPGSSTGGIARWAAQKIWESRRRSPSSATGAAAAPSTTVPRGRPQATEPAVRTPREESEKVASPAFGNR